ncbi:hypothetical protein D3C86_1855390 [compost metagenome]
MSSVSIPKYSNTMLLEDRKISVAEWFSSGSRFNGCKKGNVSKICGIIEAKEMSVAQKLIPVIDRNPPNNV